MVVPAQVFPKEGCKIKRLEALSYCGDVEFHGRRSVSSQFEPTFHIGQGNRAFLALSALGFAQFQQVVGVGQTLLQGEEFF